MPLHEFLKMARGKLESGQQKISSTTHFPEDDLVELVLENGQIVMQGQSSGAAKNSPIHNNNNNNNQVKYTGNSSTSKVGMFGLMDSILNGIPLSVPTGELDLIQEEDDWLGYSADDSLQQDYCSQLLPEMSGVTESEPSRQSKFGLMDKRGSTEQIIGDSHSVPMHNTMNFDQRNASKHSPSSRFSLLSSRGSDIFSSKTSNNPVSYFGNSSQSRASSCDDKSAKIQKQNMPESNSNLLNFSHFSRPATLVKAAKLQNCTGGFNVSSSSNLEVKGDKGGENVTNSNNHVNAAAKEDALRYPTSVVFAEQSDNLFRDCLSNNENSPGEFTGAKATKDTADGEKNVEHGVVCSSVCSGSSAERGSSDQTQNLKRKTRDNEESGCRSEDVEEESDGIKKTPARGGTGSKRSRAAEVHNLSERKRRDRINEKMRALQELIPNCNKSDKASMLDEAIEYLKTLQLQVQIMSMGAGLCVPTMMYPTGVQHMHAAQTAHFSPMGMGMGFGMMRSPGYPIYPMPSVQGAHFPSPPMPASTTYPGTNHQAFVHPGQGLPQASLTPLVGPLPMTSAVPVSVPRVGIPVDIPSAPPALDSRSPVNKRNSQMVHNAEPSLPINQACSQVQATNEVQDTSVQKNDQLPDAT